MEPNKMNRTTRKNSFLMKYSARFRVKIENCFLRTYYTWLSLAENDSDQLSVTLKAISIYPSVHKQLIRTFLEAHIVPGCYTVHSVHFCCTWLLSCTQRPFLLHSSHSVEELVQTRPVRVVRDRSRYPSRHTQSYEP